MRLLVSVADEAEARAAVAGGADIIDAKDPRAGALGPVTDDALEAICATVGGRRPVSAALGDAAHETEVERRARARAALGIAFVKVGLAGIRDAARAASLVRAAIRGAAHEVACGVVVAAYADWTLHTSPSPASLLTVAARAGAAGVLLDTADKHGPGLRLLVEPDALAAWVARAHDRGLFVALAGKLTADDLPFAYAMGADIAGVRGAACEGGRTGQVSVEKVCELRAACEVLDRDSPPDLFPPSRMQAKEVDEPQHVPRSDR